MWTEKSSDVVVIKIDALSQFLNAYPGIILLPRMVESEPFEHVVFFSPPWRLLHPRPTLPLHR